MMKRTKFPEDQVLGDRGSVSVGEENWLIVQSWSSNIGGADQILKLSNFPISTTW